MKSKILIFATILMGLVLTAMVSAASFTVSQSPAALTRGLTSVNLSITNTGVNNLTLNIPSSITIIGENGDAVVVTTTGSVANLATGATAQVKLQRTEPSSWTDFQLGKVYSSTLSLVDASNSSNSFLETVQAINSFCKSGTIGGNLAMGSVEDRTKDNEDEWVWHPLDSIEIRVNDVCNNFDKDKTIRIDYAIYDSSGKKKDFGDTTYQSLSIKDGSCKDVTFDFKVPADMDDGNYKLFVKAYVKGSESENCVDKAESQYFQDLSVERKNDRDIVVDMDALDANLEHEVSCGSDVTMDMTVYNVGDNDEDKVLVNLYNKELGINLYEVITDLSTGDNTDLSFNFQMPKSATAKTYYFDIRTFYDYNSDNSGCTRETSELCYDANSKDDADRTFQTYLKVSGECASVLKGDVSITAQLATADSDVKAGNQVDIKSTLTNVGNETTTYTIGLTGYENWATLVSIQPQTLTLVAGESRNIDIALKLNKDAEGDQTFKVRALYNGNVKEKTLSLSVQPASTFNLPTIFQDNKMLFWIVLVNVVLIVLIIIVAIRVARN